MVHLPAVKALRAAECDPLWHIAVDGAEQSAVFDLTVRLGNKIRSAYCPNHATNTLVTKILLGTVCCTPGFDKFVTIGLREKRMVQHFSEEGMRGIYSLYQYNFEEFTRTGNYLKASGHDFPPMRLIDTALWVKGGALEK